MASYFEWFKSIILDNFINKPLKLLLKIKSAFDPYLHVLASTVANPLHCLLHTGLVPLPATWVFSFSGCQCAHWLQRHWPASSSPTKLGRCVQCWSLCLEISANLRTVHSLFDFVSLIIFSPRLSFSCLCLNCSLLSFLTFLMALVIK